MARSAPTRQSQHIVLLFILVAFGAARKGACEPGADVVTFNLRRALGARLARAKSQRMYTITDNRAHCHVLPTISRSSGRNKHLVVHYDYLLEITPDAALDLPHVEKAIFHSLAMQLLKHCGGENLSDGNVKEIDPSPADSEVRAGVCILKGGEPNMCHLINGSTTFFYSGNIDTVAVHIFNALNKAIDRMHAFSNTSNIVSAAMADVFPISSTNSTHDETAESKAIPVTANRSRRALGLVFMSLGALIGILGFTAIVQHIRTKSNGTAQPPKSQWAGQLGILKRDTPEDHSEDSESTRLSHIKLPIFSDGVGGTTFSAKENISDISSTSSNYDTPNSDSPGELARIDEEQSDDEIETHLPTDSGIASGDDVETPCPTDNGNTDSSHDSDAKSQTGESVGEGSQRSAITFRTANTRRSLATRCHKSTSESSPIDPFLVRLFDLGGLPRTSRVEAAKE